MLQLGLRHAYYGENGYTNFVGDDRLYTRARADQAFAAWPSEHMRPPPERVEPAPAMREYLFLVLHAVPETTLPVLWFLPVQAT